MGISEYFKNLMSDARNNTVAPADATRVTRPEKPVLEESEEVKRRKWNKNAKEQLDKVAKLQPQKNNPKTDRDITEPKTDSNITEVLKDVGITDSQLKDMQRYLSAMTSKSNYEKLGLSKLGDIDKLPFEEQKKLLDTAMSNVVFSEKNGKIIGASGGLKYALDNEKSSKLNNARAKVANLEKHREVFNESIKEEPLKPIKSLGVESVQPRSSNSHNIIAAKSRFEGR